MKSGKTWIGLKRALWLGLFIAAAPAVAQTGGIDVCVSDADGQPLPGVTVTLSNEQQLSPVVADLTGQNGCAAFPVLRVGGSYGVEVSMPGFATRRYQRLRVSSAQTTTQTVVLTQQLTERVEVSGRVAVVDLDKTG
ncbi:MAG: carboxypeptidase-like regulatory domain-containing protein, partial [Acidobacteriota bacterium]